MSFEPMVFEPWICQGHVDGRRGGRGLRCGRRAGVDGGVIAAGVDGLVAQGGWGGGPPPADATELGFGFKRYQAPTPIPPKTKSAKIRSMGTRTFAGPLPLGVSGAPHCGHTNSAPSGI